MHPFIPIAIIAGIVALLTNKSKSPKVVGESVATQAPDSEEDEIIEAAVELLPYYGEAPHTPEQELEKPNVLSKIAGAIHKTGATGIGDLEKVMAEFANSDVSFHKIRIALVAQEFLLWYENNRLQSQKLAKALPNNATEEKGGKFINEVELLELDDVLASYEQWVKGQPSKTSFLKTSTQKCNCTNSQDRPKKLFATKQKAEQVADFWSKKNGVQQEPYKCPENNGFHLRTARH